MDETTVVKEARSPFVEEGLRAFRRDLIDLLREAPGQWVAYQGDHRIAIAETKSALYRLCFDNGLSRGDFVVRSIESALDEAIVGPGVSLGPDGGSGGE